MIKQWGIGVGPKFVWFGSKWTCFRHDHHSSIDGPDKLCYGPFLGPIYASWAHSVLISSVLLRTQIVKQWGIVVNLFVLVLLYMLQAWSAFIFLSYKPNTTTVNSELLRQHIWPWPLVSDKLCFCPIYASQAQKFSTLSSSQMY